MVVLVGLHLGVVALREGKDSSGTGSVGVIRLHYKWYVS